MEQWRQHFQKLLREPNIVSTEIIQELGKNLEKVIEITEEQWNENESLQMMTLGKTWKG